MSYWRPQILCCALAISWLSCSVAAAQAVADPPAQQKLSSKGTPAFKTALERVTYDIKYFASDELGGRKPGTPEMKLSEDHIIAAYRSAGLVDPTEGDFKQTFEVGRQRTAVDSKLQLTGPDGEISLVANESYAQLLGRKKFDIAKAELAFVGYGISAEDELNFDEYDGINVKDKVVVVIRREPQQQNDDSVFDGKKLTEWAYISTKIRTARKAGAAAIILVNDSQTVAEEGGDNLVASDRFGQDIALPFMQITRATLNKILAQTPIMTPTGKKLSTIEAIETRLDAELEPLSQSMEGWTINTASDFRTGGIPTSNIIGVIEGEGPNADETIVIGAHYDHLGDGAYGSRANASQRGMIHNGADDNATGTAAVMELARRFAARDKKPGRRLVFICFTAEEMGLLGARHYVNNPTHPLKNTVAMINFDMIGWLRDDQVTLYGWNSSKDFEKMFNNANTDFNFDLQKPPSGFAGSDHLPFNERQIPNTFIHTGLTTTYHTPEDDFETIDCEGAVKVIDFTEAFLDELVDAEKRPRYSVAKGPFRLGVGIAEVDDGLKVESIAANSPAGASDLEVGDVILLWGDEKLENRRGLRRVIRRDKDKTVTLKVRRGDDEKEIEVRLVDPDDE